jgi:hypothetical protein
MGDVNGSFERIILAIASFLEVDLKLRNTGYYRE